ncbi:MAG: hypothetical protein COA79_26515 [Planctomycetota bacterium]|nr:MAG: hypothetical protein COA79_26515 [Planctomycetota bacterium]
MKYFQHLLIIFLVLFNAGCMGRFQTNYIKKYKPFQNKDIVQDGKVVQNIRYRNDGVKDMDIFYLSNDRRRVIFYYPKREHYPKSIRPKSIRLYIKGEVQSEIRTDHFGIKISEITYAIGPNVKHRFDPIFGTVPHHCNYETYLTWYRNGTKKDKRIYKYSTEKKAFIISTKQWDSLGQILFSGFRVGHSIYGDKLHGRCKRWTSEGKLIQDREYLQGKVLKDFLIN